MPSSADAAATTSVAPAQVGRLAEVGETALEILGQSPHHLLGVDRAAERHAHVGEQLRALDVLRALVGKAQRPQEVGAGGVTLLQVVLRALLDRGEAPGRIVAGIACGSTSAEQVSGILRSIAALDGAAYHKPFPRVTLSVVDGDAEHLGSAERDRIIGADYAVRHPCVRLLVTRSALHTAAMGVMAHQVAGMPKVLRLTFRTVDEALRVTATVRPGLDAVVHRLLAVLDGPGATAKAPKPAVGRLPSRRTTVHVR